MVAIPSPAAAQEPAPAPPPPPDQTGPTVRMSGLPKYCYPQRATRRFHVRVRDAGSALGMISVYLDGRLMRRRHGAPPNVVFHKGKLMPGRHRILVIASDASGNRTRKRYRFRVCG